MAKGSSQQCLLSLQGGPTFVSRCCLCSASPLNRTKENSVSTIPGCMAVTLMPALLRSMHAPLVKASTANLLAQYMHCRWHTPLCRQWSPGSPHDPTFVLPYRGRISRDTYNNPFTLMSIMASQSSTLPDWMGSRPWALPALLMGIDLLPRLRERLQ